jgi:hypothetical protein
MTAPKRSRRNEPSATERGGLWKRLGKLKRVMAKTFTIIKPYQKVERIKMVYQ